MPGPKLGKFRRDIGAAKGPFGVGFVVIVKSAVRRLEAPVHKAARNKMHLRLCGKVPYMRRARVLLLRGHTVDRASIPVSYTHLTLPTSDLV